WPAEAMAGGRWWDRSWSMCGWRPTTRSGWRCRTSARGAAAWRCLWGWRGGSSPCRMAWSGTPRLTKTGVPRLGGSSCPRACGRQTSDHELVHHGLVEGVAELDHDVVDHVGQPGVGEQDAEHVMVFLKAVPLTEADESVRLAARRRAAADHHAWLARLDRRDAERDRPAQRPDRARRQRGGRVPRGHPVDARLWVLRQAGRNRLGRSPHRARLGGADEAPRLYALRGAGR